MDQWEPIYDNRGGYYNVLNIRYPNGACGAVGKDSYGMWVIACAGGELAERRFRTRDAAARAEREHVREMNAARASESIQYEADREAAKEELSR